MYFFKKNGLLLPPKRFRHRISHRIQRPSDPPSRLPSTRSCRCTLSRLLTLSSAATVAFGAVLFVVEG